MDTSSVQLILIDLSKFRLEVLVKMQTNEITALVQIQENYSKSLGYEDTKFAAECLISDSSKSGTDTILDKKPNLVLTSLYASRR